MYETGPINEYLVSTVANDGTLASVATVLSAHPYVHMFTVVYGLNVDFLAQQ